GERVAPGFAADLELAVAGVGAALERRGFGGVGGSGVGLRLGNHVASAVIAARHRIAARVGAAGAGSAAVGRRADLRGGALEEDGRPHDLPRCDCHVDLAMSDEAPGYVEAIGDDL